MAASKGEARGDEEELCRRFAPRLRAYGRRHLREHDLAADLVQRSLEITIGKLRAGSIREPDRIASFVLGVARRQVHEMRRRPREYPADHLGLGVDAPADLELRPLATQRLARCLEALTDRERTVVLLSFFDEKSSEEVATALTLTPGNVRVIRHRSIERLRQCMDLVQEGA